LLWLTNAVLHAFGWAIVHATDDVTGEVSVYPARTRWRGFPADRDELGRSRVRAWLARAGDALTTEVDLTSAEAAQEERIRDAVLGAVKREQ
jgi:hypothetical protein